jgi:response regulator RpfG family c-di-GMP phosphodiesterase
MNVLLVDDHPQSLSLLARRLKTLGHAVEIAAGYSAASHVLGCVIFDAIVSDFELGVGVQNGLHVLELAAELQPSARRILTSGAEQDVADSTAVHAFLAKPFSLHELERVLQDS